VGKDTTCAQPQRGAQVATVCDGWPDVLLIGFELSGSPFFIDGYTPTNTATRARSDSITKSCLKLPVEGPSDEWKDTTMFLWRSLNLFLDSHGDDGDRRFGDGPTNTEFPSGQLTSSAWEGWWHEEAHL
jgi:hypothetical protein